MSRPNKRRDVLAEENLARRVAVERDANGWTNDGLAERMTRAGCAMAGSAVFKIEKGEPRRRIVVDELVAFSRVFALPIDELLLPIEVYLSREAKQLVLAWNQRTIEASASATLRDIAWADLERYVEAHPEGGDALAVAVGDWAEQKYGSDLRTEATAYTMWKITKDEKWREIAFADDLARERAEIAQALEERDTALAALAAFDDKVTG